MAGIKELNPLTGETTIKKKGEVRVVHQVQKIMALEKNWSFYPIYRERERKRKRERERDNRV